MINDKKESTAITNGQIFDGEKIIEVKTVIIKEDKIISMGGVIPPDATVIDAKGCTLLPGLIDSHVHTSEDCLREAVKFGVTTELEMMGEYTKRGREALKGIDDIADVISPGMAVTPPNGHPFELFPPTFKPHWISEFEEEQKAHGEEEPYVTSMEKAIKHVNQQVAKGADFIKIMIDDGSLHENLNAPVLSADIMKAAVEEAHKLNKLTLAHAMTARESKLAVDIGIDGLAHVFIDRPDWTAELIKSIADSGVFVIPCLVLNASFIGIPGAKFADDSRVNSRLSPKWLNTINSCYNIYKKGKLEDSLKNVMNLYNAGVDILVGTDVAVPIPSLGGLAHGASVHHELQLLVKAGLKPIEALSSATSVPARIFNLNDRGSIKVGARADLLLVEGDPTTNISDTLSIREVWLRGKRMNENF